MILVDASVWIHHLRAADRTLMGLLDIGRVLGHPFVLGELALGNLRQRDLVLSALQDLPQASIARNEEVLQFIDRHALYGIGIGYMDAHLIASVRLMAGAVLWTRDVRSQAAATKLDLAHSA